ncbi:hypothetical protein [Bacillus thuringiensis]|uniref:hypothetical protein n=1 Tax=Bacillus cereus group TaxID=86661 RepID=UPI003310AAAA|nr:hypothetical protein [Bacillus cereus]MCU5270879.1 hypothetical protein [Bacillus cereus]MCU5348434.1 hypothetical protein [Bacillus cereus]MCU5759046.1 hypothetical protein [Bacillus cereus]HDR6390237.1 hypothetical protein [Bacillus cereus]
MLFVKELKLLITDMYKMKWYIPIWFIVLIFSVLSIIRQTIPLVGIMGLPQTLDLFFSPFTFSFPVSPLFIVFLAFGLIPFFEPLRLIRYKKREIIFLALISRIFWIVFIFTILFLFSGLIISGIYSGNWHNVWLTKSGQPYQMFGNTINLEKYFETKWMITRYILTSLVIFNMLGVFVSILYVSIQRYIYAIIITFSIIMLDKTLEILFKISLINQKISLEMNQWITPGTFQETICWFGGIYIIFSTILYILIEKKDYLSKSKTNNEKNY